jgi:hypothetical protein
LPERHSAYRSGLVPSKDRAATSAEQSANQGGDHDE